MRKPEILLYLLVTAGIACSFSREETYPFPYSLANAERVVLPNSLNEISGICRLSEGEIAAVQDELKYIYIIDPAKGTLLRQYNFFKTGDYEGIAKTDSAIYMLRSDGVLTEVKTLDQPSPPNKDYNLGLITTNNEGLCYDRAHNRLLVAAKNKVADSEKYDQKRIVYSWDLAAKGKASPLFTIDENEILEKALEKGWVKIDPKKKLRKADVLVRFNPSEIGIHPISGDVYLLSSTAKMLLVVNEKGKLLHLEKLDPLLFNKPEGLTFAPNGDLFISNEAQDRQPTLLKFNYTGKP